ncbi:MAG: sulfotransferase [Anaerolineae bacterium]
MKDEAGCVIVAGHPRSGTTLFQRLCDGHPQMRITNELGNFYYLGRLYPDYARMMLRRWRYVRDKWAFDVRYADLHQNSRQNLWLVLRFLAKMARFWRRRIGTAEVTAVLRGLFPGTAVVGDKLPHYWIKLPALTQAEYVKCIFLYRDCRDVTSSFLQQARTNWQNRPWIHRINTADKIAARWVDTIEMMERFAGQLHVIRYEQLAQAPEPTLASLSTFLGVDAAGFDGSMVSGDSIGKYRQGLASDELQTVMDIAGPTMARLGYG